MHRTAATAPEQHFCLFATTDAQASCPGHQATPRQRNPASLHHVDTDAAALAALLTTTRLPARLSSPSLYCGYNVARLAVSALPLAAMLRACLQAYTDQNSVAVR